MSIHERIKKMGIIFLSRKFFKKKNIFVVDYIWNIFLENYNNWNMIPWY